MKPEMTKNTSTPLASGNNGNRSMGLPVSICSNWLK
jgi:hypothetical protein